ncbi:MAG TPA: dihydroneopterin aldolase [Azospirillaceae bacterium]|nr:dihydroneopterin aldolase [Azospirillaceae bacterium]
MAHELLSLNSVPHGVRPMRGPGFYTIFLKDFLANPGGEESLRVNVDLKVRHPGPGFADDIASVMSYEGVVDGIRRLTRHPHAAGLENLARQIGDICLEDPRVEGAKVRVERLGADTDAAALGIFIEVERNGSQPTER